MKYQEIPASGYLQNFVQCFWEYSTDDTAIEHTILPDGYFDLITIYQNGVLTEVKLTGVWTKPITVTIPKCTRILAIRFKLLAAEYLVKHEIKSILDSTKFLSHNFWGIDTLKGCDLGQFQIAISTLAGNAIKHVKRIDDRKLSLFKLIYDDKTLSVEQLSQQVCWNSRQINRYFNNQFGFPLKMFMNIIRCHAAYEKIAHGEMAPPDEFFDQSHFIKQIKKYTGTTPSTLYENENDRFLQLKTMPSE